MSKQSVSSDQERLIKAEETLILLIRTYLQRVSSKLSAAEFVELVKAAIALHPESKLSLAEKKYLLHETLQTFGTDLSQPIPPLGERIPQSITTLIACLIRYQKIVHTDGVNVVLNQLVASGTQQLTSEIIRDALEQRGIAIAPDLNTQAALNDLASILLFERQLQTPSLKATKSEQEIAEQVNQAISEFKASYRSPASTIQPRWDSELSVSSAFFEPRNGTESNWLSKNQAPETSKDETNS